MKETRFFTRALHALVTALAVLLIPGVLDAQTPTSTAPQADGSEVPLLSLDEAFALARQNNPALKAARASVQFPEAALAQASRFRNPFLAFGVQPGRNAGTGVSVSLGKQFEIAGQRGLRSETFGARVDAANWQTSDVDRRLRLEVAQAFYTVRITQDLLQLVDTVVAVTIRLLEAADLKFQAGFAPELDRNIARIELLQAQVRRAQVMRQLAIQKSEVNALTGRPPESDFNATGPRIHGPVPRQLMVSELQRYASENRADARAVAGRGRAASANIRLARRLAYPDLLLTLGLDQEADGLQTIGFGAGFSLPLFDRNQFGVDVARAEQELVAAQAEATLIAIAREVRAALVRLETARIQLSTYEEEILELADANQDFAATAYARGELDITTAVLAQQQHTDAHVGYLDAVLAFDRAAVELEGAVGAPLTAITPDRNEEDGQ